MIETLGAKTELGVLQRIEIAFALQSAGYAASRNLPAAAASRAEVPDRLSAWLTQHGRRSILDPGAGAGVAQQRRGAPTRPAPHRWPIL